MLKYLKSVSFFSGVLLFTCACSLSQESQNDDSPGEAGALLPVTFHPMPSAKKVVVEINGEPFTEYRYDPAIKKPVLFPIRAADGTIVTRGYPLEPRSGEQADHLHHVGHWMNHGVVNQVDFWASTPESESRPDKIYGSVVHREISQMEEGEKGLLSYVADWISDRGDTLLVEETTFHFAGTPQLRCIDRMTTLTAKNEEVTFEDSKEGMMAVRVARFMEQPYDTPQQIVGDNGEVSESARIDLEGINGEYISSEGKRGDEVWGTRAPWVSLSSEKGGRNYSITIMDHPENVNYPTHWMARGYGLFAANPLGSAAYTEGKENLNFKLKSGESVTFTYRILMHDGEPLSKDFLDQQYHSFAEQYE